MRPLLDRMMLCMVVLRHRVHVIRDAPMGGDIGDASSDTPEEVLLALLLRDTGDALTDSGGVIGSAPPNIDAAMMVPAEGVGLGLSMLRRP